MRLSDAISDYLTVEGTQEFLNVSRKTVYRYAEKYGWRDRKVAGARLFLREDVEKTIRETSEEYSP